MRKLENTRYTINLADGLELLQTDAAHPDFQMLFARLDAYLAEINGEQNDFFAQHNTTDLIRNVVVAYSHGKAVGCGAFKPYDTDRVEIKRMYVDPEYRNQGIATQVLTELERWAKTSGYKAAVLETSKKLKAAVNLYQQRQYHIIPNYGQYVGVEDSVCMEKGL